MSATMERCLEALKFIRGQPATHREIKEHIGMSDSGVTALLCTLEEQGFVVSKLCDDKQTKGRVPRAYSVAPAWRGVAK